MPIWKASECSVKFYLFLVFDPPPPAPLLQLLPTKLNSKEHFVIVLGKKMFRQIDGQGVGYTNVMDGPTDISLI